MTINLINYALAKKDWEKAYEDLKVLGVGGKNLLKNSTFNFGFDGWHSDISTYGVVLPPEADKPNASILQLHHINDNQNPNVNIPIYSTNRFYLNPKAGDTITISFDFYCENENQIPSGAIMTFRRFEEPTGGIHLPPIFDIIYSNSDAYNVFGKWVRIKRTFVFNESNANSGWYAFAVYMSNSSTSGVREAKYKYREIKVELGNTATNWTPAPEDINAHPFVAELAETVYRSKQNEERIRNLENALTALGGGS